MHVAAKKTVSVSAPKLHRYWEPIWNDIGAADLVMKTIRVYNVWGDMPANLAAEHLAIRFGCSPLNFCREPLPWWVGLSVGAPPICVQEDETDALLNSMPIPEEARSRYTPIANVKRTGWLIYYSDPWQFSHPKTRFYINEAMKSDAKIKPHIVNDGNGDFIDEVPIMNGLIESTKNFNLKPMLNIFKDHIWVKNRIETWTGGYLLPSHWMSFNLGMALQLIKWRRFLYDTPDPLAYAWDALWLGKKF